MHKIHVLWIVLTHMRWPCRVESEKTVKSVVMAHQKKKKKRESEDMLLNAPYKPGKTVKQDFLMYNSTWRRFSTEHQQPSSSHHIITQNKKQKQPPKSPNYHSKYIKQINKPIIIQMDSDTYFFVKHRQFRYRAQFTQSGSHR